jgi:hypothetical protein
MAHLMQACAEAFVIDAAVNVALFGLSDGSLEPRKGFADYRGGLRVASLKSVQPDQRTACQHSPMILTKSLLQDRERARVVSLRLGELSLHCKEIAQALVQSPDGIMV